jgi:hypothetical protein
MKKPLLWMAIAMTVFKIIPHLCMPPSGFSSPIHDALRNRFGNDALFMVMHVSSLAGELLLCLLMLAMLKVLRERRVEPLTA